MDCERNAVKAPFLALLAVFFLVSVPLSGLTVALDDNYPPYSFRDGQGRLQGISVDLWNLWSRKVNEPLSLEGLPWAEALRAMNEGRVDVLDTVFLTPERSRLWLFSPIYAVIQTAVYHRDGLSGLRGPDDLKGFLVGIKKGDAGADALRSQGVGNLREYPDYESLVAAAARGEVLVFCMDVPAARHFLLTQHVTQFRQAFVLSQDGFRRAVHRDRPDLMLLLDRGFSQITAEERTQTERRWRGSSVVEGVDTGTVGVLVFSSLAVLAVLLGLILWLRSQVKRRTGQLAGTEQRLRHSEDRARALIAALPDLLFLIDREGVIREVLGAGRSWLYTDPNAFVGQQVGAPFGPDTVAEARHLLQNLTPEAGVATLEATLELRGETRTFEGRMVRLNDQQYLSIVRDVSDSRRAWSDDLHRNKLESLGLLAGGLAHDFNNSLAVIQGFVSLARIQLSQPEKALASLDKAVQATRRAAGLTSQLRVLSHSGEVHRSLLSVKDLAEEAASFALVGSPCVLAVETEEGPWVVEADPDQLSQVFHNLVLNAVQAMPQGGKVTLVFRRLAESKLSISVVDEGVGIPEEQRSRIFDPYFTTKAKGTGLGLAVVQAVVRRHGGMMEVDSRPGQGSVFTVTLPAAEGSPSLDVGTVDAPRMAFPGSRVLIMEDETDLRALVNEICVDLGFEATACRNGTEALAAFDNAAAIGTSFDLLISDILVPGDMGGRELIDHLRSRPGRLRALAITGYSVDRTGDEDGIPGFDLVVGKPFTVDELKARIVELMKSPWKAAPKS